MAEESDKSMSWLDIVVDACQDMAIIGVIYVVLWIVKDRVPTATAPKIKNMMVFFLVLFGIQVALRLTNRGKELVGNVTSNAIILAGSELVVIMLGKGGKSA